MYNLAQHIKDEAVIIAARMRISGDKTAPIRETGLFVQSSITDDFVELHSFVLDDAEFFVALKKA